MTGLGLVRTFSHGVVRLAWRHGSGGLATDGWQDKSRTVRPSRTVERSVTWHDVRDYATAWIFEDPKQYQARLHIARWQHHDSRR